MGGLSDGTFPRHSPVGGSRHLTTDTTSEFRPFLSDEHSRHELLEIDLGVTSAEVRPGVQKGYRRGVARILLKPPPLASFVLKPRKRARAPPGPRVPRPVIDDGRVERLKFYEANDRPGSFARALPDRVRRGRVRQRGRVFPLTGQRRGDGPARPALPVHETPQVTKGLFCAT